MEGEIDVQCFLKCVATRSPSNESEVVKRAVWLEKQFECFRSDKPPPHKQHHAHSHLHVKKEKASERKSLFAKDLSLDAIIRKTMTTLMNKISQTNKEHIITQVRSSFREEYAAIYASILWEFMVLSPDHQDIYTDVVILLPPVVNEHIHGLWKTWFDAHGWIVDTDDVDADYDGFCAYVKSKKRSIAIMRGLGHLTKKNVLPRSVYASTVVAVVSTCKDLLAKHNLKGFEVLLDVLKVVNTATLRDVSLDIKEWMEMSASLPPSIRFKIYDLNDKCRC